MTTHLRVLNDLPTWWRWANAILADSPIGELEAITGPQSRPLAETNWFEFSDKARHHRPQPEIATEYKCTSKPVKQEQLSLLPPWHLRYKHFFFFLRANNEGAERDNIILILRTRVLSFGTIIGGVPIIGCDILTAIRWDFNFSEAFRIFNHNDCPTVAPCLHTLYEIKF